MLALAAALAGSIALDVLVRPRPDFSTSQYHRSLTGLWLHTLLILAAFGVFLGVTGNDIASAVVVLALMTLLLVVSNAKNRMLGEPLLFSDLFLIAAVFRHPQFYLSALRAWQRLALAGGAVATLAILARQLIWLPAPHMIGLSMAAGGLVVLRFTLRAAPFRAIMTEPDADVDVRRHGLLPTLFVYWSRWRDSEDPPAIPPAQRHRDPAIEPPDIVVVVQCESFADPAHLFDNPSLELRGLAAARATAWQSGRLHVSGFGAYTMRTEYGLLFGRSEEALGFRRYDPFLTAMGETSHALPNRLSAMDWRSLFLHPHDMRFYGRDRIMPRSGFAELLDEDGFAAPAPGEGRYVTDAAMAAEIVAQARNASARTLLYAVTIENHGPWTADKDPIGEDGDGLSGALVRRYLHLVRNSDAMLQTLMAKLAMLGRPAMLVFFGDHRPSIPGVSIPGGDRHTPYVMVRFDAEGRSLRRRLSDRDMTPAELHHSIVSVISGSDG